MDDKMRTTLLIVTSLTAQVMTSGCFGGGDGGSGFFGLFGGGSGAAELFASAGGTGGSSGDEIVTTFGETTSGNSTGTFGSFAPTAAVLHNPEPTGVVLFGSGLFGVALWRRRKTRRRHST